MKENLEDFPELDKWLDNCWYITHLQWTYINSEEVAKKLVELGNKIEGLQSNLEEISEAGCLGDVSKILRRCGIDT